MKNAEQILENDAEVLGFLKTRYPIYHLSNVFFRDVQYGIQTLLERRGVKVGYADAETLARDFTRKLEKKKMLVPIDNQSWVLYNEAYKTVAPPKAAAAKPAAEKPAAPRPGGGLPPLQSATPAGGAKPGLPPLKSAAPAGAKPAGLPPLKSSAPSGGASPTPAKPPAPPPAAQVPPAAEKKQEAKPASAPKPVSPAPKGGLPPITSSVPAGKK
jgi:hypothetical protein